MMRDVCLFAVSVILRDALTICIDRCSIGKLLGSPQACLTGLLS